jgi:ArsR family transcriptional regulator
MRRCAYGGIIKVQPLVKALKALGDETRLRMINLLLVRECCVCEVMHALEISQTRASRNLAMLYEAGFLKQRKAGLWSYYSLDERMPEFLVPLVESVRLALKDNRTAASDRERLQSAVRLGTVCQSGSDGVCYPVASHKSDN